MNENIKIIRELKNFTQKFMANQLMMSQSNYSRIEKGLVDINMDKLEKISKILGVSIQDLMILNENVIKKILIDKKKQQP